MRFFPANLFVVISIAAVSLFVVTGLRNLKERPVK
jgi:hypothetical protein